MTRANVHDRARDDELDEGDDDDTAGPDASLSEVRVDKWIWAARCFKSRTAAIEACDGGHVKVNGDTARPSRPVKAGDTVEVVTPGGKRIFRVKALGERRGSAKIAQTLYDDLTPPPPPKVPVFDRWERGAGRPTKRDRRQLDKLRGW